jgi:hypothetical protein
MILALRRDRGFLRITISTVNQPKISVLVNYRLDGFSVERLMHFLNALDLRQSSSLGDYGRLGHAPESRSFASLRMTNFMDEMTKLTGG